VWADVVQLAVYLAGGVAALVIAWQLAGGAGASISMASGASKLRLVDLSLNPSLPYTLAGGLIGGAMLSAASHGTDHLIVQRLLATRSLAAARVALIGSGIVVIFQFLLFLMVGIAIWTAGLAPDGVPADQLFPQFILNHLPAGLAGLVVAGILAAAMSTISSSINALASSMTHDLYAGWSGRRDPAHLLRVGKLFSGLWGLSLIAGALFFYLYATGTDTPVVVLALSIASITYGALLGTYILAAGRRAHGRDVVGAVAITVLAMLLVVFSRSLSAYPALEWLAPVARLAWPWYVPFGTLLALSTGILLSYLPHCTGSEK
jgi:solute:Na+ symporter, SSS family